MDMVDNKTVAFAMPHIDDDDIASVVDVLRSGWITTGRQAALFEERFATRLGVDYALALNSATAGLHLALDAIGLQRGDEVIVPTITFTASAEVVRYFDAMPVLVDVEPDTLCIDPKAVEAAVTPRTRAIMPVHFGGHVAEMNVLMQLAKDHGLLVVEDAAHSFPARCLGRDAGTIGDLGVFSFYATKTITTAEGGMLITGDESFISRARSMALHGMSRDAWKRYERGGAWRYDVLAPGFKYNMTDVAAALGVSQLRKADWLWEQRRRIAGAYSLAFHDQKYLEIPTARPDVEHAWHLYTLRLRLETLDISRDEFIEQLSERGVQASVHFIPVHTFTYYRSTYGYSAECFSVATAEFPRIVSLPIYPSMDAGDVEHVIESVLDVCRRFSR